MLLGEVVAEVGCRSEVEHVASLFCLLSEVVLHEVLMLWLSEHSEVEVVVVANPSELHLNVVGVVLIL